MTQLPPPIHYHPVSFDRDAEHLRLLSIFHYIGGAIEIAVSCLFIVHIVMGVVALKNPGVFPTAAPTTGPSAGRAPAPPPAFFGYMFLCVGSGALLVGWTVGGLTLYAGRCIARRKHWMFVLVMAGINCMSVPLGTILGVFSFVVLLRDSVKAQFGRHAPPPPSPAMPFPPYPPPNPL